MSDRRHPAEVIESTGADPTYHGKFLGAEPMETCALCRNLVYGTPRCICTGTDLRAEIARLTGNFAMQADEIERLQGLIDRHDAIREDGDCPSPIEFYVEEDKTDE